LTVEFYLSSSNTLPKAIAKKLQRWLQIILLRVNYNLLQYARGWVRVMTSLAQRALILLFLSAVPINKRDRLGHHNFLNFEND
jgi:hypothetical protein